MIFYFYCDVVHCLVKYINSKRDFVNVRDARAIDHENSILSHMNVFLNKFHNLTLATDRI